MKVRRDARREERCRDARREFNALPHARGHDPRRQRVGRRVIKLAGPLIVQQAQAGLQDIQRGHRGEQLTRGLKRKAPALAWTVGKHKAKRTAQKTYKRATQRVRDIFDL